MANTKPLGAIGDHIRRHLLDRIRKGPCSVSDLVATVSISQPAVSQHLKVLREAQLVTSVKQGQRRIYQLDRRGVEQLRAYVDSLWDDALQAFADEAERRADQTSS